MWNLRAVVIETENRLLITRGWRVQVKMGRLAIRFYLEDPYLSKKFLCAPAQWAQGAWLPIMTVYCTYQKPRRKISRCFAIEK